MKERIGIFGGTFNPVHIAHLEIAGRFTEQTGLSKCIFVPAGISPFKINGAIYDEVPGQHRLNMIKSAISGFPKYDTEDYEIKNGGISYSFETIEYIGKKYENSLLYLLIGSDNASLFFDWKNWETIIRIVKICIVKKPGFDSGSAIKSIMSFFLENNCYPLWIDAPIMDISSTKIRNMLKRGEPVDEFLPAGVAEYIRQQNLYS